jgi:hypothetical protein
MRSLLRFRYLLYYFHRFISPGWYKYLSGILTAGHHTAVYRTSTTSERDDDLLVTLFSFKVNRDTTYSQHFSIKTVISKHVLLTYLLVYTLNNHISSYKFGFMAVHLTFTASRLPVTYTLNPFAALSLA